MVLFDTPAGPSDTIRFIEEQGGAGLWFWNLKNREMEWSPGFYRLLGTDRETTPPSFEALQALTHPEDVRTPGEIETIVATAGRLTREYRIIQPNGRIRWLSSRGEVLHDKEGRPDRAIGIVFDVTEQHQVLASAEAVRARFDSIVRSLGAVAWGTTVDGSANEMPSWCKMTGQQPREAVGMGWLEAVHPDDRGATKAAWECAVAHHAPYKADYRLRMSDGEYRLVHSRAVPVRGKDNSVREWVGITMDMESVWGRRAECQITGAQLRAARALLNWSVLDASKTAGVSASTIRRLEEINGPPKTPEPATLILRAVLEKEGVEFLFPPTGNPALRLAKASRQ